MRLAFADTSAVIEAPDSPELLAALRAAASDWPFAETESTEEPVARLRELNGSYALEFPGEEPVEVTAVRAACSAMVNVVGAYIDDNPGQLCLHCAAAEFAGRLVIFPSRAHAGKSTLIASLAAAGHVIFGDDIIPVSGDDLSGISLGIAPRLRLPLPKDAGAPFREFVSRHAAASDGRYLYLALPAGRLAPRKNSRPIGAIVLLDRRPEGPAGLGWATRGNILQSLILQNFARSAPSGILLDRLHAVMDRLPRLVLRYSNLEDATVLLQKTFAEWPPRLDAVTERYELDLTPGDEDEEGVSDDMGPDYPRDMLLMQNPDIRLHAVDGELFLADAQGLSIHHLNQIGAGLWNLLAEPLSQDQSIDVLCDAFPDADRRTVSDDVRRLFGDLSREGFIVRAVS
jgi:hypothetical protein